MAIRYAEAEWKNSLAQGSGQMRFGGFEGLYSFRSRMEEEPGTNPEELLGAAHAGCFSMALAAALGRAGVTPRRIHTRAAVHFDKTADGYAITHIELVCEAEVPGMTATQFQPIAESAKRDCPVSKALAGTPVELDAHLLPAAPPPPPPH